VDRQYSTRKRTFNVPFPWARREEQIHGVIESTAGKYGDLQGIAGKSLNEIAGLEIAMLPAGEEGEAV
jgi:hypothetical protein